MWILIHKYDSQARNLGISPLEIYTSYRKLAFVALKNDKNKKSEYIVN
jgi:hypothetical protein